MDVRYDKREFLDMEVVFASERIRTLLRQTEQVAASDAAILITGESGSGKEMIARAIHFYSGRRSQSWVDINCAALPENLLESELFGYERGAFSGADSSKPGLFEVAHKGTLFLDEIGDLDVRMQVKLLRILDGSPYYRLGGVRKVQVDVRMVTATNQDLKAYVREKKFRQDLYYRLAVFELSAPPLRERGEDIALLVDFFLDHYRRQHGRPALGLSKDARAKLLSCQWPGNVRQLRNVIDSAVVLAEDPEIKVSDLGLREAGGGELESLKLKHWEQRLISEALKRAGGNVPEAAGLLGIGRATLYRKLDEYGIERG